LKWPNQTIVKDISYQSIDESKRLRVLILVNIAELNDNGLFYYREIERGEKLMDFGSVGLRERFRNEEETKRFVDGFDEVIVGDQSLLPAPFYSVNLEAYIQARDYIWQNIGAYKTISEYQLPNGKKAYLIKIR